MRRGKLVEVLVARDGGDAVVAARPGPAVHVHGRGHRRLHRGELSQRRRPLRSGADRAETGLFSRVSLRRETSEVRRSSERVRSEGRDRVSRQPPPLAIALYLISRLKLLSYRPISLVSLLITYGKSSYKAPVPIYVYVCARARCKIVSAKAERELRLAIAGRC